MLEKKEPVERRGKSVPVDRVAVTTAHLDWYRAQGGALPTGVLPLQDYDYDGVEFTYYYGDDGVDANRPVTSSDRAAIQAALPPILAWFQAAGHPIQWLSLSDVHWGVDGHLYIAPRFVPIPRLDNLLRARVKRSLWRWVLWVCMSVGLAFLVLLFAYTRPSGDTHMVTVPNVVGMGVADAREILANTQFQLSYQYNVQVPSGSVIATVPPAGRTMKASRPLRVMVSKGLPMLTVPNGLGKPLEQVRVLATENGFDLAVASGNYSMSEPVGIILAQVPTPNATVTDNALSVVPSLGLPLTRHVTPNMDLSALTQQAVVDVVVSGWVPSDWPTQSVRIEAQETDVVTVYTAIHPPGDVFDVVVPVVSGTKIRIYYNESVLAYDRVYAP